MHIFWRRRLIGECLIEMWLKRLYVSIGMQIVAWKGKEIRMEQCNLKIDRLWHRECAYAYFWENVHGIGAKTIEKLYRQYHGYEKMYRACKYEGLSEMQKQAIEAEKQKRDIEMEYERLMRNRIWCIPKNLPGYPDKLEQIANPPSALFVKGKLPSEKVPAVAVVGARNCSPYGRMIAEKVGKQLAKSGIQVVSGLARGIDGISQQASLENGGAVFGVLGCGVDVCYPQENRTVYEAMAAGRNGSAIISEFLPKAEPKSHHFPMRNRIISALSDILIVVEAKEKSGTFITVSAALDQGKDVYAVPGRVGDPLSFGCNRLICQGAELLYDMDRFVQELYERISYKGIDRTKIGGMTEAHCLTTKKGWLEEESLIGAEESMESKILNLLDIQYMPIDQLMSSLNKEKGKEIPVTMVLTALATLECIGCVESEGSFYRKKQKFV